MQMWTHEPCAQRSPGLLRPISSFSVDSIKSTQHFGMFYLMGKAMDSLVNKTFKAVKETKNNSVRQKSASDSNAALSDVIDAISVKEKVSAVSQLHLPNISEACEMDWGNVAHSLYVFRGYHYGMDARFVSAQLENDRVLLKGILAHHYGVVKCLRATLFMLDRWMSSSTSTIYIPNICTLPFGL